MTRSEPAPGETTQRRAAIAHAFVKRSPGADLARCFARLFVADGVCCCDAVTGAWDVVLLLQAADRAGVERLARAHLETPEVEAWELHHAERPWLSDELAALMRSYERARELEATSEPAGERRAPLHSAYAVVDLDPRAHLAPIYTRLYFDDAVVTCDLTRASSTAILLVRARTAREMEQALSRVRAQPGVVAVRTLPVVALLDVPAERDEDRPRVAP